MTDTPPDPSNDQKPDSHPFEDNGSPAPSTGLIEVFPLRRTDISLEEMFDYHLKKREEDRPKEGILLYYDADGDDFHTSFGNLSRKDTLWLLEMAKLRVLGMRE